MTTDDLKGKSIGYALNSNAHFTLLQTLALENLTDRHVRLVPMDVMAMPLALATGTIDAFSAWEPTITMTLMKYPSSRVVHRNISTGYIYFLRSFSEKNPEIVRLIIASELRAIRWMKSDSRNLLQAAKWAIIASEEISGHSFDLTAQQVARLAEEDNVGLLSQSVIPISDLISGRRLQQEFEMIQRTGIIPKKIEWKRIRNSIDSRLINDILNNADKYRIDEFDYDIPNSSDKE